MREGAQRDYDHQCLICQYVAPFRCAHTESRGCDRVSRRGRKRWLAVTFVSQEPGHLPPEIFELCNTGIVHTLRSMHNLDALMSTTGDVTRELWARCPLLATGEAVVSSPQLKRPIVVQMRPAMSRRKFVN